MARWTFLISLAVWGLLGSCANPTAVQEQGPKIFEQYYIRYLQAERQLKAQATFFEGDSLLSATPKTFFGGVSFLGSGMKPRTLPGNTIRYTTTRNRLAYPERFRFGYKNDAGDLVDYKLELKPIDNFFLKDSIRLGQAATIVVNGGALDQNETLVFLFNDQEQKATSITVEGPTTEIEYLLPAEQLQQLAVGTGELYLVKKQVTRDSIDNRRMESTLEFYSASKEFTVKD
jgi:hypothetical protein